MLRPPLAVAVLVLCACGPVTFQTELTGNATVPGGDPTAMLAALPLIGLLSNLDFDANADFKSNGATRADLLVARVQSASVKLTQPSNATFGFLDSLQLVAKSGDTETVFADATGISTMMGTMNPFNLPLTMTSDVTAQVAQSPMSFVMRGKGRQPAADTQLVIDVVLHVEAAQSSH